MRLVLSSNSFSLPKKRKQLERKEKEARIRHLWRACARNTSTLFSSQSQLNPRARFPSIVGEEIYHLPFIGWASLYLYLHTIPKSLIINTEESLEREREMASLKLFTSPVVIPQRRRRVTTAATAAKSSGGGAEEKGILDWILGGLQKEDQLLETDPILKKVEDKSGGSTTVSSRRNSVAAPQPKKKNGGFGLGSLFNRSED